MSLGAQLEELSESILESISAAETLAEKKQLQGQLNAVTAFVDKLTKTNVQNNTANYIALTEQITKANNALQVAITESNKMLQAITEAAKVIDILAKVVV